MFEFEDISPQTDGEKDARCKASFRYEMVTLMVLRGGLLSLSRRALILLCLSSSRPGLRLAVAVALPVLCPEVATAEVEESRRRSKGTKWKLQAMLPRLVRLCVSI